MEQNEEKNIWFTSEINLIHFRNKPLSADFFHVFTALALFSLIDSQPTIFQF